MLKSGPRSDQNCFCREMQLLWNKFHPAATPAVNRAAHHRPTQLHPYHKG